MQKTTERNLLRQVPDRSTSTEANLRRRTAKNIEKPVAIEKKNPEKITDDSLDYNSHQVFTNRTPQVSEKILKILDNESSTYEYYFGQQSWEKVTIDQLNVIENLSLHDKNLTTLHPLDFQGLACVQQIDLRDTSIETLPREIFQECPSLERLLVNPHFSEEMKLNLHSEYPELSIVVKEYPNQDWVTFSPHNKITKGAKLMGLAIGLGSILLFTAHAFSNKDNPEAQQPENMIVPFLLTMFFFVLGFFTTVETSMSLKTDHKLSKQPTETPHTSSNSSIFSPLSRGEMAFLIYSSGLA